MARTKKDKRPFYTPGTILLDLRGNDVIVRRVGSEASEIMPMATPEEARATFDAYVSANKATGNHVYLTAKDSAGAVVKAAYYGM